MKERVQKGTAKGTALLTLWDTSIHAMMAKVDGYDPSMQVGPHRPPPPLSTKDVDVGKRGGGGCGKTMAIIMTRYKRKMFADSSRRRVKGRTGGY